MCIYLCLHKEIKVVVVLSTLAVLLLNIAAVVLLLVVVAVVAAAMFLLLRIAVSIWRGGGGLSSQSRIEGSKGIVLKIGGWLIRLLISLLL